MTSLFLKYSEIDANSWYQSVTLTVTNKDGNDVDLNRAVVSFIASGHVDTWGAVSGSLLGNKPLTISSEALNSQELNKIVINNDGALWLAAGASGTLTFSLAASQTPVTFSDLTLTLADGDSAEDEEPVPDTDPEPEDTSDEEQDSGSEVEPLPEEAGDNAPTVVCGAIDANSWHQKVTLTVTNRYSQAVDVNKMAIRFTAAGHPDPYSVFTGSLAGDKAPTLGSDGGWPNEKNVITLNNSSALMLAGGASGTLTFSLAATQTPVTITDLSVQLLNDPGRQGRILLDFPAQAESQGLRPGVTLVVPDGSAKSYSGVWGETLTISGLSAGKYSVCVDTLENNALRIEPANDIYSVVLANSQDQQRRAISYRPPVWFGEAELSLAGSAALTGGTIVVELWQNATLACSKEVAFGGSVKIGKLEAGQRYDVYVQAMSINNVAVSAPETMQSITPVAGKSVACRVSVVQAPADIANYVTVKATVLGLPAGVGPQRYLLRSNGGKGNCQYSVMLESTTEPQTLPFRVMPSNYLITAEKVVWEGQMWQSDFAQPMTIAQSVNAIVLSFEKGVTLQVRGWPAFLAHGGVTVNSPETVTAYDGVPVSALFKYDGFDGGGDPLPAKDVDLNGDGFLDYDLLPVHRTVPLTRDVEKASGRPVMPVMVVYTANASGGSALPDLQDNQKLRNHFGNFITQCVAAQSYKDADHQVPVTFVLNPDFLGAMQQEPYGYTAVRQKNSMQVNIQLAEAVNELAELLNYAVPVLPAFSDDLYGYLQAINYIVHQFAPDVAFGWQTNVWATGTADWLLRDNANPVEQGKQIAAFINELGVYRGQYAPDFIVFDKFERDCFSPDALAHYSWNARGWFNYLNMVKETASGLNSPAMIWQIPGGHMPTVEEGTTRIGSDHFAAGGTFLMGDERIGTEIANISSELTGMALNAVTYGAATVGEFLKKDQGYDWGQQQVRNLPDYNIFAVLWGGGSTVSITTIHSNGDDGGWLAEKMRDYYANPRRLV